MIKRILVGLAIILTTSIASKAQVIFIPIYTPPPLVQGAKVADYRNIHTVAVVSALGNHLTMRNNHFMGPKDQQLDIKDWKIDEEIEARLKQYLSSRFTFRQVPYDRASLEKIPDGQWDNWFSKFPDFLRTLPPDQVDAYIVVRRGLLYRAPGIQGVALENGAPFGEATPVVWTNYEIDIVDARTSKVIGEAYARAKLRNAPEASFPGLFASNELKVDDSFKLTGGQMQLLHYTVSRMLNITIVETLRALDTGADLPAVGARHLVPVAQVKDPYRTYKSVAIVSSVGDVLKLEHLGGTILSHDSYDVPVPDWHLDAMLETRARVALQGRFAVKDVDVNRAEFAKARLFDGDGKYAPAFPGLAPSSDVDLYVVLVKVRDHIQPLVAQVEGVGLFNKSSIGSTTRAVANYAMAVLDAHDNKVLVALRAVSSPSQPNEFPMKTLDDSFWPRSPPALTTDEAEKIRNILTDLLTDSEDEVLLRTGLSGQMIEDEQPSDMARI